MKKPPFFDKDEKELIEAYESGEFKPIKNQKKVKEQAVEAAQRYLRKDARINIRLSSVDLELLKLKAAEEGIPYQTLISSVLHKFVSGRFNTFNNT